MNLSGALYLKMREPFLKEGSATFLEFILPKFLENANNATPPRRRKAAATPQQNFLLHFLILRVPIFFFSIKEEENFVSAFCPRGQAEACANSPLGRRGIPPLEPLLPRRPRHP